MTKIMENREAPRPAGRADLEIQKYKQAFADWQAIMPYRDILADIVNFQAIIAGRGHDQKPTHDITRDIISDQKFRLL